ncbi:rod shape-determining protein RodA [Draconibacterium sp. IB214405]|uniref:rod shape-determining protein RodA n=1 Tax=Draconibacterium sp. IB214405 TaxID=3097352 RepID=UPI002A135F46|nr:rod shape-determining protein RodA [Draconibacterium sp. IB214405]MDX8340981.1 rod shape-determining protein RodA [Draconibacterium sp. IB214405]
MPRRNNILANIDWLTVGLYVLMIFLGWFNIYAALYSDEHQSIFDISQQYGKQLMWIGAAAVLALTIMLLEVNFYVFFSYIIYGVLMLFLLLVPFVGKEINGARSWFQIGPVLFQPSEFTKFATALALARYMSTHGFKLQTTKSLLTIAAIIFGPVVLILLQNDTGSALVYFSFVLVLYREGLSGVVLFFGTLIAILFVLALVLTNLTLALVMVGVALLMFLVFNPKLKQFFTVSIIYALSIGFFILLNYVVNTSYELSHFILAGAVVGSLIVLYHSVRNKFSNYTKIAIVFIGSILFTISVDYGFENFLEPHHRVRINELLGIESNPQGAGYHVNQSKIAIGSGGMWGKGYLNGTQTKFDFVPEQSTDFIFCTVGEEWGFAGTLTIILLFMLLFMRLIFLAERQRSTFSRIYGYSVAVILFFHFMVNIGMTIGMMPVIGIPLPFFSYGGSSLWSFTILLFIFIRLDASRLEKLSD